MTHVRDSNALLDLIDKFKNNIFDLIKDKFLDNEDEFNPLKKRDAKDISKLNAMLKNRDPPAPKPPKKFK